MARGKLITSTNNNAQEYNENTKSEGKSISGDIQTTAATGKHRCLTRKTAHEEAHG